MKTKINNELIVLINSINAKIKSIKKYLSQNTYLFEWFDLELNDVRGLDAPEYLIDIFEQFVHNSISEQVQTEYPCIDFNSIFNTISHYGITLYRFNDIKKYFVKFDYKNDKTYTSLYDFIIDYIGMNYTDVVDVEGDINLHLIDYDLIDTEQLLDDLVYLNDNLYTDFLEIISVCKTVNSLVKHYKKEQVLYFREFIGNYELEEVQTPVLLKRVI